MQDFRELKVWQRAHELTLMVYEITRKYPPEERFGLTQQTRRSSASIGYNIAEGCGRSTDQDFARFLWIAMGSASELDYQLLLGRDLAYMNQADYGMPLAKLTEVRKMLNSLIQTVTPREAKQRPQPRR